MATPINYGDREVSKHRKRISDAGGKFSPNNAAYVIDKLYPLPKPNLLVMATAGKAGQLYSIYPEDGSGDFTVTRASTATFINEDGNIETAAANVPRFDFSDGKPVLLTEGAGENLLPNPLTMGDFTKSGATLEGDPNSAGAELVTNGTFDTDTDWTKGDGWTISSGSARCDGTQTAPSLIYQDAGLHLSGIYLITYSITVNSGSVNVQGSGAGKFVGESRSLSGTYSEYGISDNTSQYFVIQASADFVGSVEVVSVKEVQGFAAPSVDYPAGALKLVEDGSNGAHRLYQYISGLTGGEDYDFSIYAKPSGRNLNLFSYDGINSANCVFDLSNGTIISGSGEIKLLSNGYYRCSVKHVLDTSKTGVSIYYRLYNGGISYQGDGKSGVYIAFPQLEQNSFASSWMFSGTEGATSLRGSDLITLPNFDITDKTLYFEFEAGNGFAETFPLYNMSVYGNNGSRLFVYNSNQKLYVDLFDAGVKGEYISINTSINGMNKCALIYRSNGEVVLALNGTLSKYSGASMATSVEPFLLSRSSGVVNDYYAKHRVFAILNDLSDAQLIELTKI